MVLKTPQADSPQFFSKDWRYLLFTGAFIGTFLKLALVAEASTSPHPVELTEETPFEQLIEFSFRKKIRVRNYAELTTPAFQGTSGAVPNSDGSGYMPMNLVNVFSAEYEFAPHFQILYYQRAFLFLTSNADFQSWSVFGRDPRFALRLTHIFNIKNLNTTYDIYFQPGISNNQLSGGNNFEVGLRTNTNFAPSGTRWTFGITQEFTTAYLDIAGHGQRAYGWFMPWFSYTLNDKLSLQHTTNLPFVNPRNLPWTRFQWDSQPPYMQNGVNYNFLPNVTVSLFLNNYLGVTPTLRNVWASLGLSIDLI
jgi:hypothetical protein